MEQFIYVLVNANSEIIYCGVSKDLDTRVRRHRRAMKDSSLKILMVSVVWHSDPLGMELRWINLLLNEGHPLKNKHFRRIPEIEFEDAERSQYVTLTKRI